MIHVIASLYSTMAYSPIPTSNETPNAISEKEEEISNIFLSTIRVLTKGFAVGGSLYTGLELLSAVSSKRIFKRPLLTISNIFSVDSIRFSTFIGVSCASYELVTSLLRKWQQHHNKDTQAWWIPVAGGFVAGLASSIDEANRRRAILLYLIARALGATIKILHRHKYIPTIPLAPALLFSLLEGLILICVAKKPYLLPSSYYKAILHWSIYYTDHKLDTYFRTKGPLFLPCNHAMHSGSCHLMAARDFKNCFSLYTRIYLILYSIPLLVFKFTELRSQPVETVKKYLKNVFNSSLFFAIDSAAVKYVVCLINSWLNMPPPLPAYTMFIAGVVGGFSIAIERPSRQLELIYYCTAQVLYIVWKLLCIKKPLKLHKFPAGSVWLYCASLMVIMYSYVREQEVLAPLITKALNFLLK